MVLPTTAARSAACHSCRQWVIRSFIASIGGSGVLPITPQNAQRRTFSASTNWNYPRDRTRRFVKEREDFALNDINDGFAAPVYAQDIISKASAPEAVPKDGVAAAVDVPDALEKEQSQSEPVAPAEAVSNQQEHIPWYLQVDPPMPTQENVLSARQKLPELPPHSPAILEPLLSQISVDLGLDDLTILDLRTLDPPPALGANLLMLIGTARSEKHLHVSADKLCRWLRSEHKLSPFADGLLGRQELKLKLRRKATRSKLMSAVGGKSTAETELDEGIRTGWVCVNVGRVEGGDLPKTEAELAREKNFIGFGERSTGSRIVVQMMTEEKRGDLDLEKLWATILRKSERERQALLAEEEAEAVGADRGANLDSASEANSPPSYEEELSEPDGSPRQARVESTPADGLSYLRGINGRRGQARALHTYAPLLRQAFFSGSSAISEADESADFEELIDAAGESELPNLETLLNDGRPVKVQEFLAEWRSYPQTYQHRSRDLYVSFFKALGEGKLTPLSGKDSSSGEVQSEDANVNDELINSAPQHDKSAQAEAYSEAREFLRNALADMEAEDPIVSFDGMHSRSGGNDAGDLGGAVDLSMGILRAIRFVDPENGSKEWHDVRDRCQVFLRRVLKST